MPGAATKNEGVICMKRILSILLAAMLLVAVMPVNAFAASTKTVYIVGGGKIWLRNGPDYDYDADYTVSHKSKVTVQSTSGGWSKVKVSSNGRVGWIRTYYIDGTTKDLADGLKAITANGVNVRSGYSTSSRIKGTVSRGDTVRVRGTEHDFAKVTVTGTGMTGWVAMKYIGGTVDPTPDKPTGTTYFTTASVLNVRSGPGTGYKVVAKLSRGTACKVTQSSGNWRKIKTSKGVVGWVSKNYLSKQTTARVSTNGSNLNVRKSANGSSAVLGSLRNGTKVTVRYTEGNWAYVNGGGLTGYVSMDWLSF